MNYRDLERNEMNAINREMRKNLDRYHQDLERSYSPQTSNIRSPILMELNLPPHFIQFTDSTHRYNHLRAMLSPSFFISKINKITTNEETYNDIITELTNNASARYITKITNFSFETSQLEFYLVFEDPQDALVIEHLFHDTTVASFEVINAPS